MPNTRSAVPYAPRTRRTPAASVLVPITPAELALYRAAPNNPLRAQQHSLKRKNDDISSPHPSSASKRPRDVALVVQHYNARPDVGVEQRQQSPIAGLRFFNNWVKSVLIAKFAHPVLQASPGGAGKVLDLGCGKGGDLNKWQKAYVREYYGLDIAAVSIEQARARSQQRPQRPMRGQPRFTARFEALDCYTRPITDALPSSALSPPFDVVSMQFCMHYAFESEAKARMMLDNVARWLRPGGVFVGTVPNDALLLSQLKAAEGLEFGNAVYKIRFDDRDARPVFGHRYSFFLTDAVENVPEYVVHWGSFTKLAAEYGLHEVYKAEFHDVFAENSDHPEFGPLMQRMKVVDANGESQMDEDQWEAANIYNAFAFEKR